MLGYIKKKSTKKKLENAGLKGKTKKGKKVLPHQLRLQKDLGELDQEFKKELRFEDKKLTKFSLTLTPKEGLWKDVPHHFDISISREYPIKPPKIICTTKIWHPNFSLDGHPCLNILRKDWRPILNLNSVFLGLNFLFLSPNPNDPLNNEAADQFSKDYSQFKRKARNYMNKYYY